MGPTPLYGARAEKNPKKPILPWSKWMCRLSGDINTPLPEKLLTIQTELNWQSWSAYRRWQHRSVSESCDQELQVSCLLATCSHQLPASVTIRQSSVSVQFSSVQNSDECLSFAARVASAAKNSLRCAIHSTELRQKYTLLPREA